ncbi:MAG: hypothetical protein AAGE86_06385 [Pseudomonadota bacterium]
MTIEIFASCPAQLAKSFARFFRRPFPAAPLFWAIVATQALAIAMCAYGWLVPAISWNLIALVWAYNLVWLILLGVVRVATERLIDHRTSARLRSGQLVTLDIANVHRVPGDGRI